MLRVVLWTWLHLLQCCVANQSLNPGEDLLNKPWRPIPSGIVTVHKARILRWIVLSLCLSLSISMSLEAFWQSTSLAICFIVYNELHLDSHWLMRNACNAWGYASFNTGASAIAGAYYSFHTAFSNDRTPCARPIEDDLAYFNLNCRQFPIKFLDNPCPGFPRCSR
jgi:4-hydroxybenzoate polyprenyltransferase